MLQSPDKVLTGRYRVQEGDTSSSIAAKLYNDVRKAPDIMKANGYGWEAGDLIEVPGFTGVLVTSRKGEQFTSLHRRLFATLTPTAGSQAEFFKWNGKSALREGDEVFFVDSKTKCGGY